MNNTFAASDINRLAKLSSAVVHGIDFPELGDAQGATSALLGEVDRLNDIYSNDGLLFDLRAAVCSRPMQKQAVYSLTHHIVKQARGKTTSPSVSSSSFSLRAPQALNRSNIVPSSLHS